MHYSIICWVLPAGACHVFAQNEVDNATSPDTEATAAKNQRLTTIHAIKDLSNINPKDDLKVMQRAQPDEVKIL